jgi:hypothetical protein
MIDDGDCGSIGGMKIDRGNWNTRTKPAPVPLCPPQIPYDLTQARTRAAVVGRQRLTARAMDRSAQIVTASVFDHSNSKILCSNRTNVTDEYPRYFCVKCYTVHAENLRWADPPS